MIKAVIFDFDGVLVNSMPFHIRAWQEVFSEFGIQIDAELVLLREGVKSVEMARELLDIHGIEMTEPGLEVLVEKKQKIYRSMAQIQLDEEVEPLLDKINEHGLSAGLVTGSPLKNVQHLVPGNILDRFSAVVTSDNVELGKPDPSGYLKASQKLDVNPEHCLVIENAPLGIEAANRAGMQVVGLTTTLAAERLAKADLILADLRTFYGRIDSILSIKDITLGVAF